MKQKSFEEQFPSLKGKGGDNHCSGCECDGSEGLTFSIQELQDNCLDKQKVRDSVDKFIPTLSRTLNLNNKGRLLLRQTLEEEFGI